MMSICLFVCGGGGGGGEGGMGMVVWSWGVSHEFFFLFNIKSNIFVGGSM